MEIDIRGNGLYKIVVDAIQHRQPLYHIRPGDAEMIVLNSDELPESVLMRPLIKQLGYRLEDVFLEQIKSNIRHAIACADIIGLPETFHKRMNKYWGHSEVMITQILESFSGDVQIKRFCSINSHLDLLSSGYLDKIIMDADHVVLITCRDIRDAFIKRHPHITRCDIFLIPPQQKYELHPTKSNFFPDVYEIVKQKIQIEDRAGQLCLFGTGFAGKDLGLYFKNKGGVAVDIGSVFDMWAGKVTRGANKGADSYSSQYLL